VGVPNAGKSSLLVDVLYNTLARKFHGAHTQPGDRDEIIGTEYLDKVINIDQSPIGRTPRSNPSTYTGIFDDIRNLFAELPDSKIAKYPLSNRDESKLLFWQDGKISQDIFKNAVKKL